LPRSTWRAGNAYFGRQGEKKEKKKILRPHKKDQKVLKKDGTFRKKKMGEKQRE